MDSSNVDIQSFFGSETPYPTVDRLKLSWAGDLESLKNFVSENLGLKGEWSSPGGEKKVFTCGSISISWWKNKKFLTLVGLDDNIINKLWAIGCHYKHSAASEADESTMTNQSTTGNMCSVSYCSCRCQDLSTEMEGVKLDMVISEAKTEKQLSCNATWINKVQEDLAEIRKENAELRCQINRINTKNKSLVSGGDGDDLEVLKKSNAILMDYVEVLDSSVSGWKTRAYEVEEKYEILLSSYEKSENTNKSNHSADQSPRTVNDNHINKRCTHPQQKAFNKESVLEAVNYHKNNSGIFPDQQHPNEGPIRVELTNNLSTTLTCNFEKQRREYVQRHQCRSNHTTGLPTSIVFQKEVCNNNAVMPSLNDDLKEHSQEPPWDHSIVKKATHRVNQFKEQMRDYVKKHNSLHPMHNTTPLPIILNNSVSVVEINSPTFDDPKDLGQETWGQSNGNKVTHQRRQHRQQFRRQPLNNTSERVFNRSNKGKYQQRRRQQQHRRLPNRANPNINSQEFFRSAPTRNKEVHQQRSKSVPRFRLREQTTNNRTDSWLSYLELVRSITRQ